MIRAKVAAIEMLGNGEMLEITFKESQKDSWEEEHQGFSKLFGLDI